MGFVNALGEFFFSGYSSWTSWGHSLFSIFVLFLTLALIVAAFYLAYRVYPQLKQNVKFAYFADAFSWCMSMVIGWAFYVMLPYSWGGDSLLNPNMPVVMSFGIFTTIFILLGSIAKERLEAVGLWKEEGVSEVFKRSYTSWMLLPLAVPFMVTYQRMRAYKIYQARYKRS